MANLPAPARPLHSPTKTHRDKVLPLIRRVSRIFEHCNVSFKVCEIIVLDASQVTIGNRSMADLFAGDGSITLSDNVRPSVFLQDFAANGPDTFNAKLRERCLHLFFVHKLSYQGNVLPERGSGGWFGPDTARTCYAMVSVEGMDTLATQNALAQTIAHEFGHALELSPPGPQDTHSTADNNLMKASLDAGDLELDETQCQTIAQSLAAHIRQGCP